MTRRRAPDFPSLPGLAHGDLRAIVMRNGGVFPAVAVAAYIDGRNTPAAHGTPTHRGVVDFIESLQYP